MQLLQYLIGSWWKLSNNKTLIAILGKIPWHWWGRVEKDPSESDMTWTASPREVARGSGGKVEVCQWMVGETGHERWQVCGYCRSTLSMAWYSSTSSGGMIWNNAKGNQYVLERHHSSFPSTFMMCNSFTIGLSINSPDHDGQTLH